MYVFLERTYQNDDSSWGNDNIFMLVYKTVKDYRLIEKMIYNSDLMIFQDNEREKVIISVCIRLVNSTKVG